MSESALVRFAVALGLAVVVTAGVLVGMEWLVSGPRADLNDGSVRRLVEFVRIDREETMERRERKAEKPERPPAAPSELPPPRVDALQPAAMEVSAPTVPTEIDLDIEGLGMAASDGEYLPVVKIAPVYPMTARTRGIEGYCVVEYTVTTAGAVTDVRVVEAEPKRIFDKASIEAAKKFKYRPRVVSGQPVEVKGVRNLFRYRLEG